MAKLTLGRGERAWFATYLTCLIFGIIYILGGIRLPYFGPPDHAAEWTVGIYWTVLSGTFVLLLILAKNGVIRRELDPFFGAFGLLLSPFFLPGIVYLFGGLDLPTIGTPSSFFHWLVGILWTVFWGLWVGAGLLCAFGFINFDAFGGDDDSSSQSHEALESAEDEV